ncbi:SigE family RNA polymerase sigma factor [Dactylosporangium sp. NPDC048998]|uniref:SigE family RNA polymerase sigma factor n=1 Tax=Dactylosporangium sp. NPDC048998 TaxID=3363976 RepID=UPI003720A689
MPDGDVIDQVYAACFQRLVVQLYAVTGDLSEAQEAVQEAFVRAISDPRRFQRLDNPEAWLCRVAINISRSRFRRRMVLETLLRRAGPVPVVPDPSPEHVTLMAALRRLPVGQRYAIALHYLADRPVEEVAEVLGVSIGTVKSRLSRGRRALAALLADEQPTAERTTIGAAGAQPTFSGSTSD